MNYECSVELATAEIVVISMEKPNQIIRIYSTHGTQDKIRPLEGCRITSFVVF